MLNSEFAEVLFEVLRNTLGPLQSNARVPLLADVTDVYC